MGDPTETWCRTALSGQAPERRLSPPDEIGGDEFDYYNDDHYSVVPERIRDNLQTLLVWHAHGIDDLSPNKIRRELQDLYENMKQLWEEEY